MPDILQRFLSLGLLDIGDDDTRLAKLRETAADLQRRFLSEPRIALYHALMVYSPNVAPGDTCFVEDSEALSKHWPTYENRHPDFPREIFRAISLQAVMGAADSSSAVRTAITYGLRSLEQHPVGHKEGALLQELYAGLEEKLEADAIAQWRLNGASSTGALEEAAPSVPQVASGVPEEMLKALADQVTAALGEAQRKFREVANSAAQRSELLWWKESLYSPSLGQSYREIPKGVATVFMAIDLHHQVGAITPLSVDFFLRGAVLEALSENSSLSWGELVAQIASGGFTARFLARTPGGPSRVGVKTIAEKLRYHLQAGDSPAQKSGRGGSKAGKAEPIDLAKLAVRVYLALQALRGTSE